MGKTSEGSKVSHTMDETSENNKVTHIRWKKHQKLAKYTKMDKTSGA